METADDGEEDGAPRRGHFRPKTSKNEIPGGCVYALLIKSVVVFVIPSGGCPPGIC